MKITSRAKSTSVVRLGVPSMLTRPPSRAEAKAWACPAGWPLISQTRSAPSPSVSSCTRAGTSSFDGSRVTCAPMVRASSSRRGLRSLAITSAAPAARATPTAKQPIGPQPITSTRLAATIRPSSTVCTALPVGSMMAPVSAGMPSRRITLDAGIAM